jgi:basic membrane protein A and related proteins
VQIVKPIASEEKKMKKLYFVFAALLIASMVLTACGSAATAVPATEAPMVKPATEAPVVVEPTATEAMPEMPKLTVGMVSDFGGVTDKSFNQSSWEGLEKAGADFGVDYKFLKSDVQADYAKNIQQFVGEGSNMIITVGFNMGVDTAVAAKANPNTMFAIVDYAYPDCWPGAVEGKECGSASDISNARGLTFQTDEAAFLAGYVAAAYTKTGKVATYGGLPFPTVTIFMKGFEAGVKYYNEKHGTTVAVLGWDSTKPESGVMVNNFDSTDDGRRVAEDFMGEGADVILPVAGGVGLGSAAVCKETGKCVVIGVDADWYLTAPEYKEVFLTSVLKKVDVAVYNSVKDATEGKFTGGTVAYALKDGGVDIAPFHDFESQFSADFLAELDAARKGIIDGSISINKILGVE